MVYLPPAFTEKRPDVLMNHIQQYDFGLLVSHGPAGLVASHIPFLIERAGDQFHLHGHLARPNPQVADLAGGGEVLAIFLGPHRPEGCRRGAGAHRWKPAPAPPLAAPALRGATAAAERGSG